MNNVILRAKPEESQKLFAGRIFSSPFLKLLSKDEPEIAEFDYSKENDEQIPWENAQPFKPDENPFLTEPEKQKDEEKTILY